MIKAFLFSFLLSLFLAFPEAGVSSFSSNEKQQLKKEFAYYPETSEIISGSLGLQNPFLKVSHGLEHVAEPSVKRASKTNLSGFTLRERCFGKTNNVSFRDVAIANSLLYRLPTRIVFHQLLI